MQTSPAYKVGQSFAQYAFEKYANIAAKAIMQGSRGGRFLRVPGLQGAGGNLLGVLRGATPQAAGAAVGGRSASLVRGVRSNRMRTPNALRPSAGASAGIPTRSMRAPAPGASQIRGTPASQMRTPNALRPANSAEPLHPRMIPDGRSTANTVRGTPASQMRTPNALRPANLRDPKLPSKPRPADSTEPVLREGPREWAQQGYNALRSPLGVTGLGATALGAGAYGLSRPDEQKFNLGPFSLGYRG